MSRLATVVGALSAIVSLIDYLAAKSFLSHWLQAQIRRGADGWHISPTLNLLFIAALVAVVWLLTESPASDPMARKRIFRLRANLVVFSLAAWFFFGPSIGDANVEAPAAPHTAPSSAAGATATNAVAAERTTQPSLPAGSRAPGEPAALHGHTSQFTWKRGERPAQVAGSWKPGDGLRAMARLLEDVSAPPAPPGR